MITLYDIPSKIPMSPWSPNTWKTRYCLNYKGIPYKTEWIELLDIENFYKSKGIPPIAPMPFANLKGELKYTLPMIYDSSTDTYISESFVIAQYLDKTYPDTPQVIPNGTLEVQKNFIPIARSSLILARHFIIPLTPSHLNSPSEEYYIRSRTAMFGRKLEDVIPVGEDRVKQWSEVKLGFNEIDKFLKEQGGGGKFVLGDRISFADFIVASAMGFFRKVMGEDSPEWKDMISWNGGQWLKFYENLQAYELVN